MCSSCRSSLALCAWRPAPAPSLAPVARRGQNPTVGHVSTAEQRRVELGICGLAQRPLRKSALGILSLLTVNQVEFIMCTFKLMQVVAL